LEVCEGRNSYVFGNTYIYVSSAGVFLMEAPTTITIVHFNDVYNIESGTQEPVGGAARFKTAVGRLSDRHPLILFSGDALNPALMSSVTNGRQMVPILNAIGVHCALYGNHDFDHGVDNLVKVHLFCNFSECHFY